MSQRFRRELRDKYTTAFWFLCFAGAGWLMGADEIGKVSPSERSSAWTEFAITTALVAVISFIGLWRTTPWSEVPAEQKKTNWTTVAVLAAMGAVARFVIQEDSVLWRYIAGVGTGFFAALSLTFLLVGALRRWKSEDPSQNPAN